MLNIAKEGSVRTSFYPVPGLIRRRTIFECGAGDAANESPILVECRHHWV
jgi:hypothetical protein